MSPMVYIWLSVSRMEPKTRRSALFFKGALVGVAYYVGALVGFALKFPSHSPSALWPPNSILLAALLLLPTRQWWVVLLGAFPAHLLVQLPSSVPVVMSLAFFLSNSCEALLGAFLIRRSIDGPLRFDSLKSAGVFVLAAVVVAPFLSSFLDAGFVTLIGWQEESYWRVWRARLPSNALAALAIPPVIVLWANDGPAWLRRVSTRQRVEALIMIGGLLAVSALVFAWGDSRRDATPALLFLPLPFLLWAALRFGPPASSASLLILIFVSIWGAAKGLGPFAALSPMQSVLSLQMFLLAISVPLIFLAAVIEERRKKEESLRESEARFRTMADTAPVLIWTTDADKFCTYVSQTWLDLTGRIFEEELGNGWADDIHPSDRDARLEAYAHCFDQRSPFSLEYRVRRHDGEYRWLLDKGTPRFASDGTFLGYIGSATDITERKRVEERLRVQHTVAQILAEAATIEEATPRILRAMGECLGWDVGALWRVDREAEALRCVELWHKASIEVTEFERVSREFTFAPGLGLPGRVWSSLEPEYVPDVVLDENFPRGPIAEREGLHAAFGFPILLGGEVLGVIEFFSREIRQPDQELLNMLATIGSQIGQFIERKRAEAELRESEQNYRMLFESIDEGFCTIEVLFDQNERPIDYCFLQISPSFERQTGIKNAAGRRMREIAPQHEEHWFEIYGRIALTGEPMRFENEAKQLGRWYDVYAFRVEDPKRRRVGILFNDITERKRAEAEARDSERRYREVQAELANANRVATMGQLSASIAHEVKQPITAAVTYALAARRWLSTEPPNFREVDDALSLIVKEGNRAGEVVARIPALIKKMPARKDAVAINDAILEVIAFTRTEAANNSVSVRTQLAEGLPPVQGDRVQLQQVLLNLIINAIEAMRDVGEEERELLISSRNEPDGVSVEVRDSGPGFAPETLDHVFAGFCTTKAGGLGMGLSICRSIIEAHGGRLSASANLPRGASFQFALPAIANTAS
ncbi:PAS domain S-box-containing protein [Bradyrhizobium erythrophlei]|nr:PAS domain S-box-containing protein [Bradyrhizobium erythrophlei]